MDKQNLENVDVKLLKKLKYDDDGYPFDRGLEVETKNGSLYHIEKDGTMTCRRGKRLNKIVGVAVGSVYHSFGPIRLGVAVIGLSIEAYREKEKKTFITTPIVNIII